MSGKRSWFICILLSYYSFTLSTGDQNKQLSAHTHLLIGAAAAVSACVITEPILFFKNFFQQQKSVADLKKKFAEQKNILQKLKIPYRGLFVNTSISVPAIALENVAYEQLSEEMKKTQLSNVSQNVIASLGAGLVITSIFTPREVMVINQQNSGGNFIQISKKIFNEQGLFKFWRGITPINIRNSSFAVNLFMVSPAIKKELSQYVNNPFALSLFSGITAGSFSALLTHPFDTVKTFMQADFKSGGTLKSFKYLYNLEDPNTHKKLKLRSLYRGLGWRIMGVACSMTTIGFMRDYLSSLMSQ